MELMDKKVKKKKKTYFLDAAGFWQSMCKKQILNTVLLHSISDLS